MPFRVRIGGRTACTRRYESSNLFAVSEEAGRRWYALKNTIRKEQKVLYLKRIFKYVFYNSALINMIAEGMLIERTLLFPAISAVADQGCAATDRNSAVTHYAFVQEITIQKFGV